MRRCTLIILLILFTCQVLPQRANIYQTGITGQQNLNAISALAPYSSGGMGIDTRYEGVVGTPRLFDTLLTSYLLLNDKDFYIKLEADLDLLGNSVLYTDPKTKKLFALPSDLVKELIIIKDDNELVFKTSKGLNFDKPVKENRFYQVLSEGPVTFIKMPVKIFAEADYKGAYSVDRRFDEYKDAVRYYITGNDGILRQIQLTRKSLIKTFPDKKDLISKTLDKNISGNNEELVISLIEGM